MKVSNEDLKVNFYLKKNILRNGLSPVMGRIRIGKDMVRFSCKVDAEPNLWDLRACRLNGKSHRARKVNSVIDRINVALNAKYKEIVSLKGKVTATELKNACQGISSAQDTLLSIYREHNEAYLKRIGVNRAEGTYLNYISSYLCLERYIKYKYHVSDLSFRQLDFSFIENYDFYMRIDCKYVSHTVLQKMTHLRKMMKIAIRKKIISHDPFVGYVPERPKTCQRYVPDDEFEKLMNMPLKSSALNLTRDMFVFASFTGLSYIDLYNLTNNQIVTGYDGSLWLNVARHKNENISKIPLLDVALQLIEKYKGTGSGDKVFPVKTGNNMNIQLKTIAKLFGIERRLTFHMSRHTFATETCLTQGVPIETVSRMMGHKSLSTTQIYAKVTQNKVNEEMKALSEILKADYVYMS